MSFKLNPISGLLDVVSAAADTSATLNIPQYDTDPTSPVAQAAWILHTATSSGTVTGGGVLNFLIGLSCPITSAGVSAGGGGGVTTTYKFSYRTKEGTTKRVTIS